MLTHLRLDRPLAVIDLETTGTNPQQDQIVDINVLKLLPDGRHGRRTRRLNPCIPIPVGATAIHGITDADVAGGAVSAEASTGQSEPLVRRRRGIMALKKPGLFSAAPVRSVDPLIAARIALDMEGRRNVVGFDAGGCCKLVIPLHFLHGQCD